MFTERSVLIKFVLAGGAAAVANVCARFVFSEFIDYPLAVFFAYLVGMLVAFPLMRNQVFAAKGGRVASQLPMFLGVNIAAAFQTVLISFVLARWVFPTFGLVEHAESFGHLVGVLVPVLSSYAGHKFLTFR